MEVAERARFSISGAFAIKIEGMTPRRPPQPRLRHSNPSAASASTSGTPARTAAAAGSSSRNAGAAHNPLPKDAGSGEPVPRRVKAPAFLRKRGHSTPNAGRTPVTPAIHRVVRQSNASEAAEQTSAKVRARRSSRHEGWKLEWEGSKKSHEISLRMVAVLAFAALAVIIVISPLRAFVAQQTQIRDLNAELAARKAHIEQLEDSIALWNDPEYVKAQARERLGYVMPGQTLYFVSGGPADPEKIAEQKVQEANEARRAITPFYVTLWDSITVAGQAGTKETPELENPQNVPVIEAE